MRVTLPTGTPAEFTDAPGATTGVVLIPDIGGLRPLFYDHCARLAADWGVKVCAPEPFPGQESFTLEQRMAAMASRDDRSVLADVHAAIEELRCEQHVVMGFCMGGMYALKAAADPVFDKAVSFYGMIRVPEQWKGPGQGEPLQILRERKARHVLAIIGTDDPWVSVYDGEDLRALGAEVVVYEGAEHGFVHDPERPAHRPDDAADAWRRAREWLLG